MNTEKEKNKGLKKYYKIIVVAHNWGKEENIYEIDMFANYPVEADILGAIQQSKSVCPGYDGWRKTVKIEKHYHVVRG